MFTMIFLKSSLPVGFRCNQMTANQFVLEPHTPLYCKWVEHKKWALSCPVILTQHTPTTTSPTKHTLSRWWHSMTMRLIHQTKPSPPKNLGRNCQRHCQLPQLGGFWQGKSFTDDMSNASTIINTCLCKKTILHFIPNHHPDWDDMNLTRNATKSVLVYDIIAKVKNLKWGRGFPHRLDIHLSGGSLPWSACNKTSLCR